MEEKKDLEVQVDGDAKAEVQTNEAEIDIEGGTGPEVVSEAEEERSIENEIEELKKELEETRAQAEENLDGWQRALADFANYKKRRAREQSTVFQDAMGKLVLRYLEVLDDLDRALQNRPQDGEGALWAEGVELVSRKLMSYLEAEGVKPMNAAGQQFDPYLHEALSQEPSEEHESGQIIEVIQNGYYLGDRVLRPARVRVAE